MSSSSSTPRASGSHPIGPHPKKRPWWLLALAAVVLIVLLLLLLSRCGGDDDTTTSSAASTPRATAANDASAPSSTPATSAPSSTASAPSPTPTPTTTPASASPSVPTTSGGTLATGTTPLLPLSAAAPDRSLRAYSGQKVTAAAVQVLSVPADEGFWVGTSDTDRVWVQVVGSGESPYQVQAGDLVDFTGSMVKHAGGFATRVGVDDSEGAQLLAQERAHIAAQQSSLTKTAS